MSSRSDIAEVVAALMKAPRTMPEIAEMIGRSIHVARWIVKMLRASGLVYISARLPQPEGQHGCKRRVYALQSHPFSLPDVGPDKPHRGPRAVKKSTNAAEPHNA